MKTCKGCGADIRWITTEAGKAMPLDANPRNVYIEYMGQWRMIRGYEPHFVNCLDAKRFRKKPVKKVGIPCMYCGKDFYAYEEHICKNGIKREGKK